MIVRNVVIGISGGVDSAVAALLLKRKGFNVCGVFMKNWDLIDEQTACPGEIELQDAQYVCDKLKISLTVVNFVKEYWNTVFGNFLQDYENGLTPNPDILCNRYIKFDAFHQYCTNHLHADAIATGHYARTSFGSYLQDYAPNKSVKLLRAIDTFKDQTFFLSQIPQLALRQTMFPLGDFLKNDVKQIAKAEGLDRIARKRESTGICFVGKRNFSEFISDYIDEKPGDFVNFDTGKVIGTHNGFHHWTVGQRSRLPGHSKQLFILRKHIQSNIIFVSPGTDHRELHTDMLYTDTPCWIVETPFRNLGTVVECVFRFQHTKPLIKCVLVKTNISNESGLLVLLESPLRAITPGQYAVFYRGDECLGSARIQMPGPSVKQRSSEG